MTLRADMIQRASNARIVLGDAQEQVRSFLQSHQLEGGGYRGHGDESDLYYTVFGVQGLLALGAEPDSLRLLNYVHGFGDGSDLDLVHLACLARVWANLAEICDAALDERLIRDLCRHLADFRCPDGGFSTSHAESFGSAQGAFLALGAYQDLGVPLPDADQLLGSIHSLQLDHGAFSNERGKDSASINATAEALCVLHALGDPFPGESVAWLLAQARPRGGFPAASTADALAMPDLLTTAIALFALSRTQVPLDALREINLEFCDSLWHPEGAFAGHALDSTLDCEYTFYGLLALGCLAVEN